MVQNCLEIQMSRSAFGMKFMNIADTLILMNYCFLECKYKQQYQDMQYFHSIL